MLTPSLSSSDEKTKLSNALKNVFLLTNPFPFLFCPKKKKKGKLKNPQPHIINNKPPHYIQILSSLGSLVRGHLSKSYLKSAIYKVCNELFLHSIVDIGFLDYTIIFLRNCYGFD